MSIDFKMKTNEDRVPSFRKEETSAKTSSRRDNKV
jgi:hypothetical protein